MALTKSDQIDSIAEQIGFPKSRSSAIVETLLELIKSTLGSSEDVLISGFGKFRVNAKRARRGRNPTTGDDYMIRPSVVVTFKPSGMLRKKINRLEKAISNE